MNIKANEDDVWLWHHHIENFKESGLAKAAYCEKYGLSKVKFGNTKYVLLYCKASSPDRYNAMMKICDEYEKEDDVPLKDFCKVHRINKDDFYVAMKHRMYRYIVLKRIAENYPNPELRPLDWTPSGAIAPESEVEREPISEENSVSFSDFANAKSTVLEPSNWVPAEPEVSQAKSSDKSSDDSSRHLSDDKSEPERPTKEPMKFFTLNAPSKLMEATGELSDRPVHDGTANIGRPEWSDQPIPMTPFPEPEIQLKGNRIELTFTKTVRMTAHPDTPHQKLLDIITLLKDL